jgi:hypothetical protein
MSSSPLSSSYLFAEAATALKPLDYGLRRRHPPSSLSSSSSSGLTSFANAVQASNRDISVKSLLCRQAYFPVNKRLAAITDIYQSSTMALGEFPSSSSPPASSSSSLASSSSSSSSAAKRGSIEIIAERQHVRSQALYPFLGVPMGKLFTGSLLIFFALHN